MEPIETGLLEFAALIQGGEEVDARLMRETLRGQWSQMLDSERQVFTWLVGRLLKRFQ